MPCGQMVFHGWYFLIDEAPFTQSPYRMLSEEEFKSLSRLARLDPEDESLKGLRDDFNKILDYVETIQGLNLTDSADYYTAIDTRNVLREDDPAKGLGSDAISKVAPDWETGHFVVPRVIETE